MTLRASLALSFVLASAAGCADVERITARLLSERELDAKGALVPERIGAEPEETVFVDPPFPVRGKLKGLAFTWFDAHGVHETNSVKDIPEAALGRVGVAPRNADGVQLPKGAAYVAGLRKPLPGGAFAVQLVEESRLARWAGELARAEAERAEALGEAPEAAPPANDDAPTAKAGLGDGEGAPVKLYVTNDCAKCGSVREWFEARGIAVEEQNFDENPFAALEAGLAMSRGGYNSVIKAPVITVHGTPVRNFEAAPVTNLLRRYGHDV